MLSLFHTASQALTRLFDRSAHTLQDRDERYLAESADMYDLERRMRHLDLGRADSYALGATGIFSR